MDNSAFCFKETICYFYSLDFSSLCSIFLILSVQILVSGFLRLLENPGKSWNFYWKFPGPGKSWKMILVLESPWSLFARSWKVLVFARQGCTWQLLVSNRHVYADENSHNCCHQVRYLGCRYVGMPKMLSRPGLHGRPRWQSSQHSPRLLSCCLLLYLNIARLRQGPGKMLLGAWKVLEKS